MRFLDLDFLRSGFVSLDGEASGVVEVLVTLAPGAASGRFRFRVDRLRLPEICESMEVGVAMPSRISSTSEGKVSTAGSSPEAGCGIFNHGTS